MARRTKELTLGDEFSRDSGKTFVLREMPASEAEAWADRAIEAAMQNSDIPAGLSNAGMFGVFLLGLKPILSAPYAMKKPLLDEMFAKCLSIRVEAGLRGAGTENERPIGKMVEVDIEEVKTRLHLRDQIIELHTGFSVAVILSQSWAQVRASAEMRIDSPSTPTSQGL